MSRRRSLVRTVLLAAAALALVARGGAAQESLDVRVNAAIDRGAAWLKERQRADGTWESGENGRFLRGVQALGFLTLVKSGVAESDPSIQRCLATFTGFRDFERTYSTGCLLLAWEALKRGERDLPDARAAAEWLLAHRDRATKLWAYPDGDPDLSNTQYALLGLHAASRMGVEVPKEALLETVLAVAKHAQESGAFSYKSPTETATGSMTVAAITDLRIAAMALKGYGPYEAKRRELEEIELDAFAWLDAAFRVDANPAGHSGKGSLRGWHHYWLYGLERACALAGRATLGKRPWYREGAEQLLATQETEGAWKGNVVDTCFALLFLKRATLTWSSKAPGEEYVGAPVIVARAVRPPAPDASVPFLKSWLVVGSWRHEREEPFGKDAIGETTVRSARAGERAGSASKKWVAAEAEGPILHIEKAIAPFDAGFAYAWTTLRVAKAQDAVLWIGHDDGARAWLNGKLVYENETYVDGVAPDSWWAPLTLRAGENTLLVKVYDIGYFCDLAARVSTPEGKAVE